MPAPFLSSNWPRRASSACVLTFLALPGAYAAGGHHSVDDAAILDPGQCELETWFNRATGNERALHAGANCRVGPVELSVASEHSRAQGTSGTAWGLQVKWATQLANGLSAGVYAAPVWQAHARPRHEGTAVVGLLTWSATDNLALHANLGRDLLRRAPDEARWGVSAEWTAAAGWSVVAERHRESATHYARVGARWAISDQCSVDMSRAQRLSGPSPSVWTVGMSWVFDRR